MVTIPGQVWLLVASSVLFSGRRFSRSFGGFLVTTELRVVRGDIATLDVDAVVNAANTTLLGGGGVDGAIHYAAGPALMEACRAIGGCPTGEARITPGFNLPARWIIHTVGPVWKGGDRGEPRLLAACYENSLLLAKSHKLRTVAFPAISTGAYAYPPALAAGIAIDSIRRFVAAASDLEQVLLCCYSGEDVATYKRALRMEVGGAPGDRKPTDGSK
jgi:O-acetyl-ADP-ribose deacetylase (regulator of RNase III)